jgi:hypothetical protein
MSDFKNEIFSYLISQPGILPSMMRKHSSLGTKIVTWLTGEKPVLIIGGEPGSGKSLFMGELILRRNELIELYPKIQSSLALISYDRIHYLFLKRLAEVNITNMHDFLPEGETHPEARKLITEILQDLLLFVIRYFPSKRLTILEVPLIDHRGEDIVANLSAYDFLIQIFIIQSPTMQSQILQQNKQQTRELSAPALAIRQIHEALLQQRGIISFSHQAQNNALIKSWEQWLSNYDGAILSWDPSDDEAGFLHTRETLKSNNILPNPLAPQYLYRYATCLIEAIFEIIPNLEAFANEVRNY